MSVRFADEAEAEVQKPAEKPSTPPAHKDEGRTITPPTQRKGNLFGEVNALRHDPDDEEEKEALERAKFNENTCMGRLAVNKYFEWTTLGVIVFNALYLGYDCDYNARWGKPEDLYASSLWGFILFDNFFCLFFTVELLVRFLGYKRCLTCCTDKAFLFDLLLVLFMIAETWVFAFIGTIGFLKQVSIMRLLRLARLFRMGKIMRYFPELQLIVKGMVAAVRSVFCATMLLLLVLYVFSIIFTNEYHQGLKADDDEDLENIEFLFGSMGKSMRHLLIMATILDDITACTNAIRSTDKIMMLMAFIACVLINSFTVFNMLLGILCEVVEATQNHEQEKTETETLRATVTRFFKKMDIDGNGQISRNEFVKMSMDPAIMETLAGLHIKQADFEKYAELMFTPQNDGDKVPVLHFEDAVRMIMRLRPGQSVNACDFKYFQMVINQENAEIMEYIETLERLLNEAAALDDVEEEVPVVPGEPEEEIILTNFTGKKPAMTLGRLARSNLSAMASAPPLASRWQALSPRGADGAPSPRSPMGKASPGGDLVVERIGKLAEKRRELNSNVRDMMYGGGQMHMAYYHGNANSMPQMSQINNVVYPREEYEDSDEDGYTPPFSPNGFVLD